MVLLLAVVGTQAQQATPASLGNALKQKQRSARFLARRGVALSGRQRYARSAARMFSEAKVQHRAMAASARARAAATSGGGSVSLTGPWLPVGPTYVTTPEFGAVTGRVTSIAVDASDASGNTVYVGSTGGGVWKSTNAAGSAGAVTFTPLTDTLSFYAAASYASLSIGAISVQPVAAGNAPVLLAGTGDPNDSTDSYYGAGILRSADGGVTWSQITQTDDVTFNGPRNFNFYGNSIAGFAWGTVSASPVVVAAVSQAAEGVTTNAATEPVSIMGLYYSTDTGQTWRMATITDGPGSVVQSAATTFLPCDGTSVTPSTVCGSAATSVVWNPIRQMFYAAVRFHGYYQSADGATWTRLAAQPGANLTTLMCPANNGAAGSRACPILRGALAVQPVTGDMYALTVDVNNLDQGLWQDLCQLNSGTCTSATVTFANQIADAPLEAGNLDSAVPATTIPQADYDLYLAAVPSQQDTLLFAGTTDVYRCSLANSCAWRNTTYATSCASAHVAPAQHAIEATLGAQGLLYFGNDGGLWRSTDAVNQQAAPCSADDASHYQNLNTSLGSLAEIENLAEDVTNPQNMMVSLGALGTAAPQGSATGWAQVLNGEGNYAAIDPAAPQNWYATSYFGAGINRCTEGSACDTAGFAQPVIGNTQVDNDEALPILPAPWILDPQNSANVILGTCRVWRGPGTGGSGWSDANLLSGMLDGIQGPSCSANAEIRSLAASGSPTDAPGTAERIYAGMAGECDVVAAGSCDLSGGATVPGHIYTATVTDSSGASTTWTDLFHSPVANGGSTNGQFNPGGFDISSLYVDPHDPTGQTVYATVEGYGGNGIIVANVYGSTDGGSDWSNISGNLPNAPANSIVVDPNDANTVYVAMDTGVYVTTNIGSCTNIFQDCWTVFGTSLPNAPVIQLTTFNEGSTSVLRAATYGRGVWQTDLVTAGTARTTVTATPAVLTFTDQQMQTQSAAKPTVIANTGTFTFTVTEVSVTGDFVETDNCAQPVMPAASCTVQVVFAPTKVGTRTGVLTVFGNVPGGQVTVALTGNGVPGAAVVLTPLTLNFPETLLGKTAASEDLTISNTGGVTASLTSETVTGDFTIATNTCGGSLNPNSGCTLSISFAPTASGKRTGVLTVVDSSGTQTAELSGIGESLATDGLSPLNLTFAGQLVGTPSLTQQVKLTNNGDQALQLIATQVSGDFNAVNSCGTSLEGHATCAIAVNFVPTQIGAETGTLIVSDALRSQTVTLAGTGLAPAGVSITPSSLSFGNFGVGQTSAAKTITVTNNGGVPLTGFNMAVTGDFTTQAVTCGSTLAVGDNCQIGVVFSPSQAGARSGNLTVSFANIANPFNVELSGNGDDFTLQVSGSPSATLTSGQTATFPLIISPVNGSAGTVALACTGAPQNATCTVNPGSVVLTGTSTASATVTIVTGSSGATAAADFDKGKVKMLRLVLAMLLPIGFLARKRRRWERLALVGLLALLLPIGCGLSVNPGSGTSSNKPPPVTGSNPTPSGTYTLTVTGTGPGLSHSVQVTLTVE